MDAACGEPRQGCRVSPCPSISILFQEAVGHPVGREGHHWLPIGDSLLGGGFYQGQDAAADFGAEQVAQVEADVIEF